MTLDEKFEKNSKCVSSMALFLTRVHIVYALKTQPMISLSSRESEFIAASDEGKTTLDFYGILNSIDLELTDATSYIQY